MISAVTLCHFCAAGDTGDINGGSAQLGIQHDLLQEHMADRPYQRSHAAHRCGWVRLMHEHEVPIGQTKTAGWADHGGSQRIDVRTDDYCILRPMALEDLLCRGDRVRC